MSNLDPTAPSVETYLLTKMQIQLRQAMSRELLHSLTRAEIEEVAFNLTDDLVYSVKGYVWTAPLDAIDVHREKKVIFEAPANPWQHLKQCFAPAWFTARWPVVMRREVKRVSFVADIERFFVYPKAPLSDGGSYLAIPRMNYSERWTVE